MKTSKAHSRQNARILLRILILEVLARIVLKYFAVLLLQGENILIEFFYLKFINFYNSFAQPSQITHLCLL